MKDRERPNENINERSLKTVSNSLTPSKTKSLRVSEIETSSIPVTLKDLQHLLKIDKDLANPSIHKGPQRPLKIIWKLGLTGLP